MARLVPCSACERHVRADETACPFCGFGPLRCTAPVAPWVRSLSVAVVSLGMLAGCTGKNAKPPSEADDGAAKASAGDEGGRRDGDDGSSGHGSNGDDGAEGGIESPPPSIYGGPRMMSAGGGEDEAQPQPDGPEVDIYGGPRMTSGESEDIERPIEDGAGPEPQPRIYGSPRMRDEPGNKTPIEPD